MRIAFDVKGTLVEGQDPVKIRHLLYQLHKRGHNITVWSNSFSYTQDFLKDYPNHGELVHNTCSKMSKREMQEMDIPLFDYAIEDDYCQDYLGANKIWFVSEICAMENMDKFIKELEVLSNA